MIQGQEKISNLIDKLTLDMFPRTLMLVGARGSGKHLIVSEVSKKFNLNVIDITENLELSYIEELYNRVEPYIYIIQANNLTVKDENTILKFLEEPLKNSYIILLAETEMGLLQTITNRCQIWYLQNYKKDFLKQFTDNELILSIANTPGQIKEFEGMCLQDMVSLADKIIFNIDHASVSNTLTLTSKVAFKDESKGFPVNLFIEIMKTRIVDCIKSNNDKKLYAAYELTSKILQQLTIKNVDKKCLFDGYLIKLRSIMKG